MRVRVGLDGEWVDGREVPIVVQLTNVDVRNIRRMGFIFSCYAQLPTEEQVRWWEAHGDGDAAETQAKLRAELFAGAVALPGDSAVPTELMESWLQFQRMMPPYSVGEFVRIVGFSSTFMQRQPALSEKLVLQYGVVVAMDLLDKRAHKKFTAAMAGWSVTLLMLKDPGEGTADNEEKGWTSRGCCSRFKCESVFLDAVDVPWAPHS